MKIHPETAFRIDDGTRTDHCSVLCLHRLPQSSEDCLRTDQQWNSAALQKKKDNDEIAGFKMPHTVFLSGTEDRGMKTRRLDEGRH